MSTYRVINAAWQLGGDEHLICSQAKTADVLVVVEARDHDNDPVPVGRILGPGWRVFQDRRDGARAGTAIAVRRAGPVKVRRVRGVVSRLSQLSRRGHKVQARYERTLHLRDEHGAVTVLGFHLPLKSTRLQGAAVRTLRARWLRTRGRRIAMGDANMPHKTLRVGLSAPHSAGADVMGVIWSGDWPRVTTGHHAARGSDHDVITLRTHVPTKEMS